MPDSNEYPSVKWGKINGPVRWESLDGDEMYTYDNDLTSPRILGGKKWGITHLQKKSNKGFLIMKPFIIHAWIFKKLQKKGKDGNYIPGSEDGWYFRSPGWRWDVAGTKGKHWILSKGYIGKHWD